MKICFWKKIILIVLFLGSGLLLYFISYTSLKSKVLSSKVNSKLELYWFIPDGLRADPKYFNLFDWANSGYLPNIKWMMEHGAYGYSIPQFPGHTATNMATLTTGVTPLAHGIYDGNLRQQGEDLKSIHQSGYSSTSKKISPIWYTLEALGKFVSLISIPGSTPPELQNGITLKGRFGNWGMDLSSLSLSSKPGEIQNNQHVRLKTYKPTGWKIPNINFNGEQIEISFQIFGIKIFGLILGNINQNDKFTSVIFSLDKKTEMTHLSGQNWSPWIKLSSFQPTSKIFKKIDTQIKIKMLSFEKNEIRIRVLFDQLNEYSINPSYLASKIHSITGPMVDYPDNNPLQLLQDELDRKTFLEETKMSLSWHKKIAKFMLDNTPSQVVLQNIYTPNQMLTSKWWLPYLDPKSTRYSEVSDEMRKKIFNETLSMYQGIDTILGEIIHSARSDSTIVFSSDHGVIPLNQEVLLNNLFYKMGLLKYFIDSKTGTVSVNWKETKVIFLQTNHIYINPKTLLGSYFRSRGQDYEALRNKVREVLSNLKNENGTSVYADILNWEDSEKVQLPKESVGDLILVNTSGFSTSEKITRTHELFSNAITGGYKQGIIPKKESGMLTPFLIVGPNIKNNFKIENPINHIDQYPTIMKSIKTPLPFTTSGRALSEIFKD